MKESTVKCNVDMPALINAVRVLNEYMKLEPQIMERRRSNKLIGKLHEATSLLEPGDEISWQTGTTLSALRAWHRAVLKKRSS